MPAYWLTPSHSTQSARPNWYNVAYLRTGAYKGMGQHARGLGQNVYDAAGNYIGPTDSAGNPIASFGTGANILSPTGQLLPGVFTQSAGGAATPSTGTWLLIGGGALLLLIALGGRR